MNMMNHNFQGYNYADHDDEEIRANGFGGSSLDLIPEEIDADGMISHENEEVRDRVAALEKKVQNQEDEIICLKSALSDAIRRLQAVESGRAFQNNVLPSKPKFTGSPARRVSTPSSGRESPSARRSLSTDHMSSGKYSSPTPSRVVPRGGHGGGGGTASGSTSSHSTPGASRKWPSTPSMNANETNGHMSPGSSGLVSQSNRLGQNGSWGVGSTPNLGTDPNPAPAHLQRSQSPATGTLSPAPRQYPSHSLAVTQSSKDMRRSGSLGSLSGRNSPSPFPIRHKEPTFNQDDRYIRFYLRGRALNFYMPSSEEDYQLNKPLPAPEQRLKLEWVYGYRGRDARSNLYLLPTGEMVYFIASVVVLYNVEEQMQRHYLGHTDDVKCLAVHPDKMRIATGQVAGHDKREGRPHIRIWNSLNLQTLKVIGIGDFDRAVACLAFSKADGGQFLAAVDEANEHVLSLWDWEKGQRITETKSSTDPVLCCEFHPCERNVIVTCGKGQISFWNLEGGTLTRKFGIYERHEKPKFVTCVAFAENGDVLSGDSNGNLYIWGRGTNKVSLAITGAHEGGIFSICIMKDGTILTGGRDRRIVQWNAAYKKTGLEHEVPEQYGPIRMLTQGKGNLVLAGTTKNAILQGSLDLKFSAIIQGHTDELWGLAQHPNQHQFVTCGYDRMLYFWDTLSHTAVWSKELPDGAHCACFHPEGGVVVVGTVCGRWLAIDTTTREILTSHTDGSEMLQYVSFSPDGKTLAIGSRDNIIYLYNSTDGGKKFSRSGKCTGHSSFVTHLDWSADSQCLMSNSGDYEVLFWNVATCRQITSPSSMRDVEWATHTCTLGFNVCGIWPEGADGTDINACVRSHKHEILASGDDFGKVNLFTYPCGQPKSSGHMYSGHSSHVTNVQFVYDDSRLLSTGGKDMAILQWEVIG